MNLKIYQIEMDEDYNKVKFCSLAETINYNKKVDPEIYRKVFESEIDCKSLEDVFKKFNTDIPKDYEGHSVSVSDVIEADGGFFFCDSVGFEKIEFDSSKVKQENMIRVLVVEPHKEPYIANMTDDYKAFQKIVGGTFECIYPDNDAVIYCNDEAKLIGLEGNRKINFDIIAGTFVIAGDNHTGETISLTDEQIEKYSERFKEPEEYTTEEVEDTCFMEFISF